MKNLLSVYMLVLVLTGCILPQVQTSTPAVLKSPSETSAPQPIAITQNQSQANVSIPERNRELALRLTIVTKKAEGELIYGNGFRDSSEIMHYLQKKHSKLYTEFNTAVLKFSIDEGHVLGLVCDAEKGFAIAEDSPCTPEADVTYGGTNSQCIFTLRSKDICLE